METVLRDNTILDLHLSDVYYEKKPGQLDYKRCYCNQGYILFRPFHSYVLPILEYSDQNIKEINKTTEIFTKLSTASIFINVGDNGAKWVIEYINTSDMWMFGIDKAIAKLRIISIKYD